jgi:hypothetical protein
VAIVFSERESDGGGLYIVWFGLVIPCSLPFANVRRRVLSLHGSFVFDGLISNVSVACIMRKARANLTISHYIGLIPFM